MQLREYAIRPDGQVCRRTIIEEMVDFNPALLQAAASQTTVKLLNAFELSGDQVGPTHLMIDARGYTYASTLIKEMPLRAPYRKVNGCMVPQFTDRDAPVLTMRWQPWFTVKTLARIYWNVDAGKFVASELYLFALDTRGATYKMPLPNLYDDCKVCLGGNGDETDATTIFGTVLKAHNRLADSQWNADLWRDVEKTQNFFRFESNNKDSYNQLKPESAWTNFCVKVGTALAQHIL